jgi:hypothetical protein
MAARWMWMTVVGLALVVSAGCCAWADKWCHNSAPAVQQPCGCPPPTCCQPVAPAPQCCPPGTVPVQPVPRTY